VHVLHYQNPPNQYDCYDSGGERSVLVVDLSNADKSSGRRNQPADVKGNFSVLLRHIHVGPSD
jgi:hypothetical protein